jgi:hypothetical protein
MLRGAFRRLSLSRLQELPEFERGLEFAQQNNFSMAELEFERCLQILGTSQGDKSYNYVLERLAVMQRVQGKHQKCSKSLADLVHLTRQDLPAFQRVSSNYLKQLTLHDPAHATAVFNSLNYSLFEEDQLSELKRTAGVIAN